MRPDHKQGAIGILDRRDMDHFAEIFLALQKRGMTKDDKGINIYCFHAYMLTPNPFQKSVN